MNVCRICLDRFPFTRIKAPSKHKTCHVVILFNSNIKYKYQALFWLATFNVIALGSLYNNEMSHSLLQLRILHPNIENGGCSREQGCFYRSKQRCGQNYDSEHLENMMSPVGLNIISGKPQQLVRKAILNSSGSNSKIISLLTRALTHQHFRI